MRRVAVITGASRRTVRRPHESSRGGGRAAAGIRVTTRPRGGLRAKLLRGNGGGSESRHQKESLPDPKRWIRR
jgi:hypothetical protein